MLVSAFQISGYISRNMSLAPASHSPVTVAVSARRPDRPVPKKTAVHHWRSAEPTSCSVPSIGPSHANWSRSDKRSSVLRSPAARQFLVRRESRARLVVPVAPPFRRWGLRPGAPAHRTRHRRRAVPLKLKEPKPQVSSSTWHADFGRTGQD